MKQIRQGDVLLIERPTPRDVRRVPDAAGLRVPGERTGHAHVLPADVYEDAAGRRLLYLPEEGALSHEEHETLPIPAGWWEPVLQREFIPRAGVAARWEYD